MRYTSFTSWLTGSSWTLYHLQGLFKWNNCGYLLVENSTLPVKPTRARTLDLLLCSVSNFHRCQCCEFSLSDPYHNCWLAVQHRAVLVGRKLLHGCRIQEISNPKCFYLKQYQEGCPQYIYNSMSTVPVCATWKLVLRSRLARYDAKIRLLTILALTKSNAVRIGLHNQLMHIKILLGFFWFFHAWS